MRMKKYSLSLDWDNIIALDGKSPIMQCMKKSQDMDLVESPSLKELQDKPTETFYTESSYTGQWDELGMAGYGTFIFPHGVEYEGSLKDGMFHGEGTITYPMGQKVECVFEKGIMIKYHFIFADGLPYTDPWGYCQMPDRRFFTTLKEDFQPAGSEYLTNRQPTRTIPEGCYDNEEGFYNPKTKCIVHAEDLNRTLRNFPTYEVKPSINGDTEIGEDEVNKILSVPTRREEQWIMSNCRKAWDESTGYRPDLYEMWTSGKRSETERVSHHSFIFDAEESNINIADLDYQYLAGDYDYEDDDDDDRVYANFSVCASLEE